MSFYLRFIAVFVGVFLGGRLGLLMAVEPGYAGPMWPPAGIALAALLLGGRKLWPAVWLGSFANHAWNGYALAGQWSADVLLLAAIIGFGLSLQAWIGAWASGKWVDNSGVPALDAPRQILVFFLLTGPLAGVIGSGIGVAGLLGFGRIAVAEWFAVWFDWWLGGALGVIVTTPLIFCLFAKPRALWRPRLLRLALPIALTSVLLELVFVFVLQAERDRVQLVFDNQAAAISNGLLEQVHNVEDSAYELLNLYAEGRLLNRREFALLASGLLQRRGEIQAVEWVPLVAADELPAFEQSVRADGFPDFKVKRHGAVSPERSAESLNEYCPILYLEPMAGNEYVFGLDTCYNHAGWLSKQAAKHSGLPSLSQRIFLKQREDQAFGVLVSVPVYAPRKSQDEGRQLAGYLSIVVRPTSLLRHAAEGIEEQLIGIELRDLSATPDQAELVAWSLESAAGGYGVEPWVQTFRFLDRDWQLNMTGGQAFGRRYGSMLPWSTLVGGLMGNGLLAILLLVITGRTANVEALVEARTRELQKTNDELKITEQALRVSESQLRAVLDSVPMCVKLLAPDGTLLDMNPAGQAIIELDGLDQIKGKSLTNFVVPEYQDAFRAVLAQVFDGGTAALEFEAITLKGNRRWLDTHAVPLRDGQGKVLSLLAVTRDITERKQAESSLQLASRVFGEAHEGILITDAQANIVDVNPTFCEITGFSRDAVIGKNPRMLQSGLQGADFYRDMWNSLVRDHHWQGEVWNRKKNGELYAELLTLSAICDEEGQVVNYVGLFSDITHLKQQQRLLEMMAHYDPLTQLPNRALFADRLKQAMAHSKRDRSLLAICFLDLDGFKPVNDELGHDAGDQVLIEVAKRLKAVLREEDTVSRHGGDEFALLIGDLQSVEQCYQTLDRVHQAIAETLVIDGRAVHIGVSSGVTLYPLDDADPDTLLRHADQAMYQAKLAGKNRYCLFDTSQDQMMVGRREQLAEIEQAFEAGQFCLYFQPKVNMKSGQVVGVEALLRWRHPQRGVLAPLSFLPIVAGDELEIRIGDWVIEQAWQQLGQWHRQGLEIEVSVNISAKHLLQSDFIANLDAVLATLPAISSRYLQLEILESTALDDLSAVNRIIKSCRDTLGVTMALDDFGTGYSSLAHMRHLPVNVVKIDKSFVHDMLYVPADYSIVESVIGLSQAFRHDVVAEGVETEEQGLILLLLDCHVLQGYAIAKPMPGVELTDWVRDYRPFPSWQNYAGKTLTPEQSQVAIRRIELKQWLNRVRQCLDAQSNGPVYWPIMDASKSHFGRWLKQAYQLGHYDEAWLRELAGLHTELLSKGRQLAARFSAGETQAARAGFAELEAVQQRLDACLGTYA